ncbi:DUF4320 family protein [Symbiobacterium terraclitae]|uniref:DUF4320 family protein n=1 Tax=Symbiobacterium terraclitae TaxID=557451 RepID=UPI0035B516FE
MIRFLRDSRGNGESISFVFVSIVLMLVVLNVSPPIMATLRYYDLSQVHRDTLLRMEIAGGLTPAIEDRARDTLAELGFSPVAVTISGTPAPVDYGSQLTLEISYQYTYREYAWATFTVYPVDQPRTMTASGSSVSLYMPK